MDQQDKHVMLLQAFAVSDSGQSQGLSKSEAVKRGLEQCLDRVAPPPDARELAPESVRRRSRLQLKAAESDRVDIKDPLTTGLTRLHPARSGYMIAPIRPRAQARFTMSTADWIQARVVPLELTLAARLTGLRRIPFLRCLCRTVTARLRLEIEQASGATLLYLDFQTPWLRLPVTVDQTQIGTECAGPAPHVLEPASFRFFDWHSWQHIDGFVTWIGAQETQLDHQPVRLIKGLIYRVETLPSGLGNLGLRVAEGVENLIRVRRGGVLISMRFEPGYWLLEPVANGYRQVAICRDELMTLIVSLSEIGSEDAEVHRRGVEHLWSWVRFHLGEQQPQRALKRLIQAVKDWGPLALAPLYTGLQEIIERLQIPDQEQILFDLYADHWGLRGDPSIRLILLHLLVALDTEAARSALQDLSDYTRNRSLEPAEFALLRAASDPPGTNASDAASPSCHVV